jgi:hypothetical protein
MPHNPANRDEHALQPHRGDLPARGRDSLPDIPLGAAWDPPDDLDRLLRDGIANSQDFRRAAGLFAIEIGSGRLPPLRAKLIAEYLDQIKSTLIGPAPVTTNIFAQIQAIAKDARAMSEAHQATLDGANAPIDLIEASNETAAWGPIAPPTPRLVATGGR